MIEFLFIFVLFQKYSFWILAGGDFYLGTSAWFIVLSIIVASKIMWNKFHFSMPQENGFRWYVFYAGYSLIGGMFFLAELGTTAFLYAAMLWFPMLFVPRLGKLDYSIGMLKIGLISSVAVSVALIASKVELNSLGSRQGEVVGIGPNSIGFLCSVALVSSLSLWSEARMSIVKWAATAMVLFFAIVLLFSASKVAIISVVLALLVVSLKKRHSSKSVLYGAFMLAMFIAVSISLNVVDFLEVYVEEYLTYKYSWDTLSGRTLLWEEIFRQGTLLDFIIGRGYSASRVLSMDAGYSVFGVDSVTHAHSAIVEALVNVGFVGLFLLIVVTGKALLHVYRNSRMCEEHMSIHGTYLLQILIILLVRGVTEGGFAQAGTIESVLLFVIIVLIFSLKRTSAC